MKLTYIYNKCFLGGLESAVKNKLDYLRDLGVDCEFIFFRSGLEKQTFSGYKTFVTNDSQRLYLLTRDTDVIVNVSPYKDAFEKLFKLNKPIFYECHIGANFQYNLSFINHPLVKGIMFPTLVKLNEAKEFIPKGMPAFALPNFPGKIFSNPVEPGVTYGKKIVLWVGRIEHDKNWPILIKLANKLTNDYLIRIVTDTAPAKEQLTSSEYPRFQRMMQRQDLQRKIQVIPNCSYHQMPKWYASAASGGCYLSTSYTESFGMTVLEAMAAQCPMVLSDLGSFREITDSSSLFFQPDDVDTCLKHIYSVCENENNRNRIINKQNEVYKKYDGIDLGQKYLEMIKEATGIG